MIAPPQPSSAGIGRLTGFVLCLVVAVCLTMIGFAGYMKYELDRAEGVLAAPETALNSDQDSYDKLRRDLGYSGFVGLAQSFAATHDAAIIPNMKAQLKNANDVVARMPDRTSTEVRHDLQSIITTFETTTQKAEKSISDPLTTFGNPDMVPLYAALPVLDSRITSIAAVNRLAAQNHLQFWATLLTLICWGSLIIASATVVGIYISLRDRNSAPLRALAQSVKNMAHGDMRTSIWGMERSDMVGELARAIDLARYHFSQLPDMSVLSDQGPVRLRFEGSTKSLFEAMMQLITRDSEEIRNQSSSLTDAVYRQNQAVTTLSTQVETILNAIMQRGQDGTQQIQDVLQRALKSAETMQHAQANATHQLNRIIPYMQERAQGLAEITQIAGKQVAQSLQSLTMTEHTLKASAEQSDVAIKKLSTTADDLGGRLFGAVNLLQASGKVLAETTDATRSRLNEATEQLNKTLQQPTTAGDYVARVEGLIKALETAQKTLEDRVNEQTKAAQAQIELLTTHSTGLLSQSTTTAQTLSSAADKLRDEEDKLDKTIDQITTKLDELGSRMEQQANAAFGRTDAAIGQNQNQLAELVVQVGQLTERLAMSGDGTREPAFASNLLLELKTGFETTVRSLGQMNEQMTNLVINNTSAQPITISTAPAPAPTDDRWKEIAAQVEATRASLTQLITQQVERLEARLTTLNPTAEPAVVPVISADTQEQMEQQTQILTELVATLGILDTHMQQIKSEMKVGRG